MKTKKGLDNKFVVSLEDLLEAGCHFGHQSRRWHPKMGKYIWGERDGVHIIDLEKTRQGLTGACETVRQLISEGKVIVFVGTKRQAEPIIEEEATRAGIPFVGKRWLGGTLTNWQQVKKSIERLKDLKSKRDSGELDKYTKRERVLFDREILKLGHTVGGLKELIDLPQALFVVDVKREDAAIREAKRLGILVIAIVDTNCNPGMVDAVIPANDDAIKSIRLIVNKLADAVIAGKSLRHP